MRHKQVTVKISFSPSLPIPGWSLFQKGEGCLTTDWLLSHLRTWCCRLGTYVFSATACLGVLMTHCFRRALPCIHPRRSPTHQQSSTVHLHPSRTSPVLCMGCMLLMRCSVMLVPSPHRLALFQISFVFHSGALGILRWSSVPF